MSHLVRHHAWPGYVTVASILAAGAMFVWIFLKDAAKILTNWQTGRW
jgi:hypothetical protein